MATPAQIQANRRNAQFSTGPRSAEGKQRSRLNSLKHGLRAQDVVPPWENPEEFEELRAAVGSEYNPRGVVAIIVAERVVLNILRLRRCPRFEKQLRMLGQAFAMSGSPTRFKTLSESEHAELNLIIAFLRIKDDFFLLSRYEREIAKELRRDIHELERLQAESGGEPDALASPAAAALSAPAQEQDTSAADQASNAPDSTTGPDNQNVPPVPEDLQASRK